MIALLCALLSAAPKGPTLYNMVRIPKGSFIMGGAKGETLERPLHKVELSRSFYIGETEVTQQLFKEIMGYEPVKFWGDACKGYTHTPSDDSPVYCVSWYESIKFANALSKRDGLEQCYLIKRGKLYWPKGLDCTGYRLPTEAEWEKAARGVDARIYPWGNFFSPAWCSMDLSKEEKSPTAVDAFPVDSSVYGLRGCGGGIAEWTSSPWQAVVDLPKYSRVEIQPAYPCETKERTWRGGAWNFPDLMSCSANRVAFHEEEGTGQVGFRVVRSIQERE